MGISGLHAVGSLTLLRGRGGQPSPRGSLASGPTQRRACPRLHPSRPPAGPSLGFSNSAWPSLPCTSTALLHDLRRLRRPQLHPPFQTLGPRPPLVLDSLPPAQAVSWSRPVLSPAAHRLPSFLLSALQQRDALSRASCRIFPGSGAHWPLAPFPWSLGFTVVGGPWGWGGTPPPPPLWSCLRTFALAVSASAELCLRRGTGLRPPLKCHFLREALLDFPGRHSLSPAPASSCPISWLSFIYVSIVLTAAWR